VLSATILSSSLFHCDDHYQRLFCYRQDLMTHPAASALAGREVGSSARVGHSFLEDSVVDRRSSNKRGREEGDEEFAEHCNNVLIERVGCGASSVGL